MWHVIDASSTIDKNLINPDKKFSFISTIGGSGGNNIYLTSFFAFCPSLIPQTLEFFLAIPASEATFLFLWYLFHGVRVKRVLPHVGFLNIGIFIGCLGIFKVGRSPLTLIRFHFPFSVVNLLTGLGHSLIGTSTYGT